MRTAVVCVALVAGAVFAEGVGAATVGSIEGDVLVNRGDGYRSAKGTIPNVPAGTQLMVRPGGSAIITYSGTCAVRIAPGVWSVNEQAPCADGRDFIDFTGRADRPVLNTRPAPPPVTETASINPPAPETASVSGPETQPRPETRVAPPVPSEGIGQPYSTVYRTTAGEAPPPPGGRGISAPAATRVRSAAGHAAGRAVGLPVAPLSHHGWPRCRRCRWRGRPALARRRRRSRQSVTPAPLSIAADWAMQSARAGAIYLVSPYAAASLPTGAKACVYGPRRYCLARQVSHRPPPLCP